MDILQDKSDLEVLQSLLAEIAKATNELKCARSDLSKASGRLSFALACVNELLDREEI